MKRFYKEASVAPRDGGTFGILLDGRPVRTPARAFLALPNAALADAIAQEWADQGEDIDPAAMPMTGFANAAIDQVVPDPAGFAATISVYGESDLLCYREENPAGLAQRQAAQWQPLLDWAGQRYGISFAVTQGVIHITQPPETLARLHEATAAHDPFLLAALSPLVGISGSLVIGLAVVEQAFDLARLWQAAELDELWQAEQWGDDDEALARRARRHQDFTHAARFAALTRQGQA
ncbi:MAG: ATP12 family chaperone protein [Sphingobium sp.]